MLVSLKIEMKDAKNEITINRTALILSGIFPGIGQIYKGEYLKGLDLIIISCISLFFLFYPMRILFPMGVVLVPTLWVWGAVDAGILFPRGSRRRRYSRLRRRRILLAGGVWALAVIVFAITATVIRYKITTSKPQDSKPAELTTTTSSDMTSPPADTQPVRVESEHGQPQQIDAPVLEETPIPYVVTVGAFSQYQNAERQRLLLSQKKYQALIVPAISSRNHQVYAVVVSGFSSISDAKAIANKLKQEFDEYRYCFVATLEKPTVKVTGSGR